MTEPLLDPWSLLIDANHTANVDETLAASSRRRRDARALDLIESGCRLSDICSALDMPRTTARAMVDRARRERA